MTSALEKLLAEASARPWAYYTAQETAEWKGYPEEEHWASICSSEPERHIFDLTLDDDLENGANGRLATVAVNHIEMLEKALEKDDKLAIHYRRCGKCPGVCRRWAELYADAEATRAEALAAVRDAAQKALEKAL